MLSLADDMKTTEYMVVGKIGSTYGIQGWLKVYSFTEWTADILGYTPWYVEDDKGWVMLDILDGHPHGKGVVVKFSGFDNPEQARLLIGKKICIKRSQLPTLKNDEYYWSDLEGLKVINQVGTQLGKVIYLMDTGSNDVLVIEGQDNKEYGIPYLPDVITKVDITNEIIYVNWDLI